MVESTWRERVTMVHSESLVPPNPDFRNLIQARATVGLGPLIEALNGSLLPAAITRYNSEFGPRYFGRPETEPINTEPRKLSDFRTRLGQLIEYGIGVTIDSFFENDYRQELRLTFAPASMYPDFYARDAQGAVLLRIDAKSLHDESAEYSARFELPTAEIRPSDDLLLYIAWQWSKGGFYGHTLVYPLIVDGLFIPAIEIAEERDRHLVARGGRLETDGAPVVPSKSGKGLWSPDTNYGKINRIVHESRRDANDLTDGIHAFLSFTQSHADAARRAAATAEEAADPEPTQDEVAPG